MFLEKFQTGSDVSMNALFPIKHDWLVSKTPQPEMIFLVYANFSKLAFPEKFEIKPA